MNTEALTKARDKVLAIERHHVEQNARKGRHESRSHTLALAREAIAAIDQALEGAGEPVAWMLTQGRTRIAVTSEPTDEEKSRYEITPLYTTPQPPVQPVAYTPTEIRGAFCPTCGQDPKLWQRLLAPAAIPDGFVLVPKVPTEAMLAAPFSMAGWNLPPRDALFNAGLPASVFDAAYRAMLASTPSLPAPAQRGGVTEAMVGALSAAAWTEGYTEAKQESHDVYSPEEVQAAREATAAKRAVITAALAAHPAEP